MNKELDDALREAKAGAWQQRDQPQNGHQGQGDDKPAKPKPSWRDSAISARALCDKKYPTVKYVVPGLFPEGVTLLVSRPKLGKSWLLQQIGASGVALGNNVLVSPVDSDKPAHGDVLYLNLE